MKMQATVTFVIGTADGERMIHGGMVLEDRDPAVKACPEYFVALTVPEPQPAPRRRRA